MKITRNKLIAFIRTFPLKERCLTNSQKEEEKKLDLSPTACFDRRFDPNGRRPIPDQTRWKGKQRTIKM
jgi:hypothetical protein